MIGSKIRLKAGCAPNINFAIGTPEARVFFDPQKTAAILSSAENAIAEHTAETINITKQKITNDPRNPMTGVLSPCPDQMPPLNESQNDV